MAKSLRIEIAMAGQEEINRQFKQLSEAGKDCFSEIAAEANKVGFQNLDPSFLEAKYKKFNVTGKETVNQINEIVATGTKFQQLAEAVGLVEKALMRAGIAGKALLLVMNPIGAAITIVVALLGAAFVSAAISAAKAIAALERQAIGLGASFEQLSKLKNVMGAAGVPFDAVSKGLEKLQADIEKFSLDKVKAAFDDAQKNIAAGWGPGADNIAKLQQAAESAIPSVRAAGRAALEALGQPINDRVTPALESMVKWAGDAVKAIPLIAGEVARLGSSGDRAAFLSEIFKRIVADSPNAVAALQNVIKAMESLPPSAERDRAIVDALGKDLGARLVQAAQQGGTAISDLFEKVKGGSQATADAASKLDLGLNKLKAGLAAAFENIPIGKLSEALDAAGTKVQGFAQAVNNISWETFTTGATTAMTTVNPLIQTMVANVQQVQTSLAQDIWTTFVTGATNALSQVGSMIQQLATLVQSGIPSAFQLATSIAVSAIGQISTALDGLMQKINQAMQALSNLQAKAAGGALGAHASGGLLRGRGTGTSDSNLAWVSRGEHIMPARAVRQPGVLQLLEALRHSGGNLRSVLDRMGHFALGGMVSAPAFARGGTVGGMSNVTIQFPGVQPITGLRASSAVVDELRRSAALAQVRSGGRKPSRYT